MKSDATSEVLSQIDGEELVELTRALVRIGSVYRPEEGGNEEAIARFIAKRLEEFGLGGTLEEVAPGRPNVIAILDGKEGGQTLMFEAHSDVATEGDPGEWTHPPFEAVVENGRIYGRGACDTLGNLAAALIAAKAIKESKARFRGKIVLGIPVDEEGMMLGIKHFIKQGWADDVDAAIICEPTDNQLGIAQKGALRAEVMTYGRMSHGCMPLSGLNPIPPMMKIIQRIVQLEREEIEQHGEDELLGFPSLAPTVLQAPVRGEPQLNVIPSRCRALLDIRTIPGQSHQELKRKLAMVIDEIEQESRASLKEGFQREIRERLQPGLAAALKFSAKLDVFEDRPWTKTPKGELIVQAVEKANRMLTGRKPTYIGVPGATDGTFLSAWKGIPIVTIGAGDRFVPHQSDEWVSISQLEEIAKIYAAGALTFLK